MVVSANCLNFGITLEQYQEMLLAQNGVCAICRKPETMIRRGRVQMLGVDHHHESGALRDLLCAACNLLVGHSRESPEFLRAAADYLERHAARPAGNVIPMKGKPA